MTTISSVEDIFSSTPNSTIKDEERAEDYFYKVEQLTFLWVLFAIIVIGNMTVLGAMFLSKGRKSRMNFFIKHLALTDLGVGLINVLTDIVWKITISWDAGLIACKVIRFLQVVVTYASTYVLVALSIDRYDAITHPMNFSGSWRRARGLVISAWALSALFSSPILILYETKEIKDYGTQCWIEFSQPWHWKLYMTLVSLSLFVIPAILIAGCYTIIVVTIWKKSTDLVSSSATKRKDGGNNEDIESRRASSRGLIPKAKVKTVKMTFVIILVFILCWSPYIIFNLLQVYGCIPDNPTVKAVATFIQSLAPLNSAANPLIYCLFSTNVGQCICNLFRSNRTVANKSSNYSKSTYTVRQGRLMNSNASGNLNHKSRVLKANSTATTWTGTTTVTTDFS